MIKQILHILLAISIAPMVFVLWVLTTTFFTLGTITEKISDFISDNLFDKIG
jgi:hypothetical protein